MLLFSRMKEVSKRIHSDTFFLLTMRWMRPQFSSPSLTHAFFTLKSRSLLQCSLSTQASRPGPIPLGDRKQQKEFEDLVKRNEQANMEAEAAQAALDAAAEYGSSQVAPENRHPDALKEVPEAWEGNRNPHTGEIGGPKGKEPTRYGDWERNGRVYDF
jgi:hypothetical protein